MLQGIVQGLRADIRRDVMLLQPTTLEGLIDAVAIGEASTKVSALKAKSDIMVTGQLADTPTRGLPTRGLDISRTGQLAD